MRFVRNITIVSLALLGSAYALEFGQMGNISAGMGGAGVALKNSQWAIYYNPALLAVNKKSGFAYSFGVGYRDTNLSRALGIDVDNAKSTIENLQNLVDTNVTTLTTTNAGMQNLLSSSKFDDLGLLGEVLEKMGFDDDDKIDEYLELIGRDFDQAKSDLIEAINEVKNDTNSSSLGLLEAIIDSLTEENLSDLVSSIKDGDVDVETILKKVMKNGITLSAGSDAGLNQLLNDIDLINDIFQRNDLSIVSQNGLVVNFGSKKKRGTISIAIMPSLFASASAKLDSRYSDYVFGIDNGYYKITTDSSSITISSVDDDSSSILSDNANHMISAKSVAIAEVPVGYGHLFETKIGNIAVGVAVKYIFGLGYNLTAQGSIDTILDGINSSLDLQPTHTFGLDLGLLYSPRAAKNFNIGLVAKNLNAPKIKTNNGSVTLNTQVRAGVSYGFFKDRIVLAADADLAPNDTLSITRPYSQMLGGGVLLDLKWVDLRLGAMYDFQNKAADEGTILTAGINILGFLDIAVQSNLHLTKVDNLNLQIPSYLYLKIGGGFSW